MLISSNNGNAIVIGCPDIGEINLHELSSAIHNNLAGFKFDSILFRYIILDLL